MRHYTSVWPETEGCGWRDWGWKLATLCMIFNVSRLRGPNRQYQANRGLIGPASRNMNRRGRERDQGSGTRRELRPIPAEEAAFIRFLFFTSNI
jgi:hypothetical protein